MILFSNAASGEEVGRVHPAKSGWTRFKGMLFSNPAKDPSGLWLVPCKSIHMLGMRWALDVIFLSKELKVLKICAGVKPNTPVVFCPGAHSVIEFFPGHWNPASLKTGDRLEFRNL